MTELEAALLEVAGALDGCELPYVLIGGLAVAVLGEPRSTLDVDVSVWTEPEGLLAAVECLSARLRPLPANPQDFVRERRVLPVITSSGVRADIVFSSLAVESETIRRGVRKQVAGRDIRVASVEDMLLMKLVSEREKDFADAKALLRRFGKSLDRAYLLPKLQELSEALSRPDILQIFHQHAPSSDPTNLER
jgi:hypothetical protein